MKGPIYVLEREVKGMIESVIEENCKITEGDLDNWFTYHKPEPEDLPKFQAIREKARELAGVIVANTPTSPDQDDAIRHLRIAVMIANASIACKGK